MSWHLSPSLSVSCSAQHIMPGYIYNNPHLLIFLNDFILIGFLLKFYEIINLFSMPFKRKCLENKVYNDPISKTLIHETDNIKIYYRFKYVMISILNNQNIYAYVAFFLEFFFYYLPPTLFY